jgi:hypothetical protein
MKPHIFVTRAFSQRKCDKSISLNYLGRKSAKHLEGDAVREAWERPTDSEGNMSSLERVA